MSQGGKILGAARYPMASVDLSSFLLQAQTSKAKVVGIAGSGTTFVNAVKAAAPNDSSRGGAEAPTIEVPQQ